MLLWLRRQHSLLFLVISFPPSKISSYVTSSVKSFLFSFPCWGLYSPLLVAWHCIPAFPAALTTYTVFLFTTWLSCPKFCEFLKCRKYVLLLYPEYPESDECSINARGNEWMELKIVSQYFFDLIINIKKLIWICDDGCIATINNTQSK